jgi:Trypsin-co-occurring domain 1
MPTGARCQFRGGRRDGDEAMGKRVIEVPLDGEQVVLVEVSDEDFYQGGDALAPVANVEEMLARAGGSVRSAMDNVIMPTMHTVFDRISQGTRAPDSVEVEFGLRLTGTLGAVFASTQAEGHIQVKMTWSRTAKPSPASPAPSPATSAPSPATSSPSPLP